MAGIIDFNNDTYWGSSGGAFRAVCRGNIEGLGNDGAEGRLREFLDHAKDGILYIDFLRDLDREMRLCFSFKLAELVRKTIEGGPARLGNPELFEGYVGKLRELQHLVEDSLSQ